jgi:membrane protease YdiL (CAAX protease family)
MTRQVPFPEIRTGFKIFWLLAFILFFMLVFSAMGMIGGTLLYGKNLSELAQTFIHPQTEADRSFILFFQFFNQLGFLFFPVLLFVYLFSSNGVSYLKMNKISLFMLLLAGISVYAVLPLSNWLGEINQQMSFPSSLSGLSRWMKARESQADQITAFLLQTKTTKGLLLNLFIIALIPAVGEEMLFRGLLQRLLNEWTRSVFAGVFLTALIFSAIHLQFFGFLPRFLLGLVLGILLEITQSLWAPVAAHFVNNATLVVLYYLKNINIIAVDPEKFGTSHHFYILLLSLVVTLYIFYRLKMLRNRDVYVEK